MIVPLKAGLDNPAAGSDGAGCASKEHFDYSNRPGQCQTSQGTISADFAGFSSIFNLKVSADDHCSRRRELAFHADPRPALVICFGS